MEVCRVLHSLSYDEQDVVPVKYPVNILERVDRYRQVIVYHRPVAEKQLFDLPVYQVVGGDERTVIYFPVDASYLTVIFVCPPGIVIYDALRVPLYGISVLPSGLSFESSP